MTTSTDPTHTFADVQQAINMSLRYVKRHAHEWPHHRFGRFYRFSEEDIAAIKAMHRKGQDLPASPVAGDLRPASRRRAPARRSA